MKELLESLRSQLAGASGGTKAVAALTALALVAIVGLSAVVARRPDYQMAFSDLSDHELPRVTKALSEASLAFRVSQPPAPFSVFVDAGARSQAYHAVYGAGALDKPLRGILTDSGVSSVFHSAEERRQGVRKREWEEMEKMLEVLEFVVSARVRTSPRPATPLSGHGAPPSTASVTLRLAGAHPLSRRQTETVANLVSRGLGIEKRHLVVSDQEGNPLYGGAEAGEDERGDVRDLLAHQADFDARVAAEANDVLASILGPNRARVTVSSQWDFDQSTTRTETPVGKGTLIEETRNQSERPLAPPVPAGLSANLADPSAGAEGATEADGEPALEKTSEEHKEYRPTVALEERVRFVPRLERLSVALFLDHEVDAERVPALEETVLAAVGFVPERDDFRSVVLPFFAPETSGEGPPAADARPAPSGRPWLELLLRRSIEVAAAAVFVVLLVKSLVGARRSAPAARETVPEAELDPELLARARVEELLRSDPEQVGEILSAWARGEPTAGARS